MATMVKEKRRQKKKTKQIRVTVPEFLVESPSVTNLPIHDELQASNVVSKTLDDQSPHETSMKDHHGTEMESENTSEQLFNSDPEPSCSKEQITVPINIESTKPVIEDSNIVKAGTSGQSCASDNTYTELNLKLESICIPAAPVILSKERELSMEKGNAYLKEVAIEPILDAISAVTGIEVAESADIAPSAPMLDFSEPQIVYGEQVVVHEVPKLISMPLEEAVRLYGGKEMAEVMAMSEKEEAVVEAGVMSGPDHPLADLLSTLKRSMIALEQEGTKLTVNFAEEEKYRSSLWKIEKRSIFETEKCTCGETVYFKASYEHAELQRDKLPIARMKLESILRDVQESYCHHQHAVLLAHCQIEELISETIKSNKNEIREALSLILQALKMSDNAPAVLSSALRRWCTALAAALVDTRDLRQLLFLLHHLFRQTRSVRWAASVIDLSVTDSVSAARTIALLDILLTRPRLESAVECTEDKDEEWEEVDKDGSGGAVSDGSLRERDMLALLRAFPLRALIARLALVTQADLSKSREWQWSDSSRGHDVVRACCGVRALLGVLARAARAHAHYTRLRRALGHLALSALRALAALHEKNWQSYSKELEVKIQAELEASFVGGWEVLGVGEAHRLPASLLSWHAARDYCVGLIDHLHASGPHHAESLSLDIPAQECGARVAVVACAAIDRRQDYDLARIALEFLFQTGIRRNIVACNGGCRQAARDVLPRLLAAHPHLYAIALHLVAEASQVEKLDPSSISCLAVEKWRPQSGEARAVAADWAQRCPHLLPPLLLTLDCTPHTGLSLDTQVSIGSWLCEFVHSRSPSEQEEWCWSVLRRLRLHHTCWGLRPEAPPPDPDPDDLFSKAFALMASSWGHSIPLICSEGVAALCSLAATRVADAIHCLAPIMLLLVDSPESIASTEKFTEFFALVLNAGPSLVQRALGRGAPSGAELLTRLMREQLEGDKCGGVPHTALVRVWIWALWRPALPAATALLDSALRPRHCWQLDEFAHHQNDDWVQQMTSAMRMSAQAPLICYCALRAWLAQRELAVALLPRLELALHAQRSAQQRIHVANALKLVGSSASAEDLVIYKTAAAILVAPHSHVAHLLLWALLMHLYLQRPQIEQQGSIPPVGPLYFSGLIKSRTLAQLKRRLQDAIKYHQNEAKRLLVETSEPASTPTTSRIVKSESRTIDNQLRPLSITDLTCESSDSNESDSSEEEKEEETRRDSREDDNANKKNVKLTIAYHKAAENMLNKYAAWLDEGEKVRAAQHQADISRFIPENLQEAACELSTSRRVSTPTAEPLPLPALAPPAPAPPDPTPYEGLMNVLKEIGNPRRRRSRRSVIKSPVDYVDFKDVRSLLTLVDTHVKDLQKMSKEICTELSLVSTLNAALWQLVGELRVPRPLPLMHKCCANKCKPVTCAPPGREWCISVGAVQGVKENRAKAYACLRRMARPRPQAARTAAALLTIARRMRSSDAAKRVVEIVFQAAAGFKGDISTTTVITAFLDLLAERWLCSDGVVCAYLIRRSYNNRNAQALIGPLVAPQRVSPAHIPTLHSALLRGPWSPEEMFSYLSRFEMTRWADSVGPEARREVLNELTEAARRWGGQAEPEYQVLLELVGMQSAAVCRETELCGLVTTCCRACAEGWLPPPHLPHVTRAAARCAAALPCDQLGHLLREIGVIWWEARTGLKGGKHARYAAYAPHVAALLSALHRAFVASAVQLSYAPERVGALAWSSLLESWSAWVVPHGAAPLLPSTGDQEHYTQMLQSFHHAVLQVMTDCPGTEEYLLSQMFEWTIQTFLGVHNAPNQENRVQISAFLAELAKAPWTEHQWLQGSCLQALLQVCQLGDKELGNWCSMACSQQEAATWLRHAPHELLPARLPLLLHLFTAAALQHGRILEEATRLPWYRLPEAALEEALDRFFAQHYSLSVPYHELPQFRVLLSAGELYWPAGSSVSVSASSRQKRCRLVSQWVRAASAPALAPHVAGHSRTLLAAIAAAAPHLVNSEGELEELLGRAMVIMCIEPAAAAALAVWEPWVRTADPLLSRARVRCVSTLTAFEYYAPLAEAAVRTYFTSPECPSWSSIAALWAQGHWRDATPLCTRGRLHAAYATLAAHAHAHSSLRAALLALLAADVHFVEDEAIVAVWICAACRLVLRLSFEGSEGEARAAACALLGRWAEPARRSLLQLVALQGTGSNPTPAHRLLSLFALCVLSPNSESDARAFEAACSSVPGSGPDVVTWARAPHPKRLPRLAMRLYPHHEKYFKEELDMAPEENT